MEGRNKKRKWEKKISFGKHCIFMSSRLCLPYYFGEHCIFMKSRHHLPYYIREHWIFKRRRLCLPYYFEENCIFKKSFNDYYFILGSTVYLWEVFNDYYFILGSTVVYILKSSQCLPFYFGENCIIMSSCLHLPFYHVQLRWRKSYNSFYNPNLDHE